MSERKRLGISPELYCAPLFFGLSEDPHFECITDVVAANAARLRKHDLDGAFLSPIDYARESSEYCIIPNGAVSSQAPTNTIVLLFKEGLHTIKTLAVRPGSTSEVVLATILLGEQFDIRPTIIPSVGSPEQMLHSADAALLVGNAAFESAGASRSRIDLVEEWNDLTDVPYVHGFWCTRGTDLTREEVESIQAASDHGRSSLGAIAEAEASKLGERFLRSAVEEYLGRFSYSFGDEEQEALLEFLRYAYYHGVLPDVADINLYPPDGEDNSQPSPLSLN
jgi:chorismate dehydratase